MLVKGIRGESVGAKLLGYIQYSAEEGKRNVS